MRPKFNQSVWLSPYFSLQEPTKKIVYMNSWSEASRILPHATLSTFLAKKKLAKKLHNTSQGCNKNDKGFNYNLLPFATHSLTNSSLKEPTNSWSKASRIISIPLSIFWQKTVIIVTINCNNKGFNYSRMPFANTFFN